MSIRMSIVGIIMGTIMIMTTTIITITISRTTWRR